jgi:hypothetical protein
LTYPGNFSDAAPGPACEIEAVPECPFDFLSGNQTARELLILLMALPKRRLAFAQLGLGPLALGDINAGADVSREGPVGRKARYP